MRMSRQIVAFGGGVDHNMSLLFFLYPGVSFFFLRNERKKFMLAPATENRIDSPQDESTHTQQKKGHSMYNLRGVSIIIVVAISVLLKIK